MQKASDKGYTAMNEFDAWHRADRTGEAAYVEAVERGVSSANIAHDMGAKAAATVIRTYGDERYQAAIADVVGWLEAQYAGRLQSPIFLADEITRRFGKGQDHG